MVKSTSTARFPWLLVLILLTFSMIGLNKVNQATDAAFEDTQPFLQVALFIKDNGGISNFLNMCLSGTYTANVQKPLYPLLLSPFASRELLFFPNARLFSLAMGMLTLIVFFYLTRDLYGEDVAYWGTGMLAANATFLGMSSHVQCEALLTMLLFGSLYCMMKGLTSNLYWPAAGIFGGLAYLTKGTGFLLVPLFAMVTPLAEGPKVLKRAPFWMFFLLFLLISSPIIIRNMVVYGQPMHEGINEHAIWFEHWEDVGLPEYRVVRQYPEVAWEGTVLPTMGTYVASHSLAEIGRRMSTGIANEFDLLLQSLAPLVFGDVLAKCILGLFLFGLWCEIRNKYVLYNVSFVVTVFCLFAFYNQSVPAIRFISVLIPFACLYAAVGMAQAFRILGRIATERIEKMVFGLCQWLLGLSFAFMAGYTIMTHGVNWPAPAPLPDDVGEFSRWISSTVRKSDLVVIRSGAPYWVYAWHVGMRGKILSWNPSHATYARATLGTFNKILQNPLTGPTRYVVVHEGDILQPTFLSHYFGYSTDRGIHELRPIDNWNLVYRSSHKPSAFLVYQVNVESPG